MKTKTTLLAFAAAIAALAPMQVSASRLPPAYAAAFAVRRYGNSTSTTIQPATAPTSTLIQPATSTTSAVHQSAPTAVITTTSAVFQPTATASSFPIAGYVEVPPAPNTPANFGLMPTWKRLHQLSKLTLSIAPVGEMGAYGMFKCQYRCDALPKCVSFYGQFVNVGESPEKVLFECLVFDAFLQPALYVEDHKSTDRHVCGYNRVYYGQSDDA